MKVQPQSVPVKKEEKKVVVEQKIEPELVSPESVIAQMTPARAELAKMLHALFFEVLEKRSTLAITSETTEGSSSQTVRCGSYDDKSYLTVIDIEEKGTPSPQDFKKLFGDRFLEIAPTLNDETKLCGSVLSEAGGV
jgi:hypothetical protein